MQDDYNSNRGNSSDSAGYNTLKALERAESRASESGSSRTQQSRSSYAGERRPSSGTSRSNGSSSRSSQRPSSGSSATRTNASRSAGGYGSSRSASGSVSRTSGSYGSRNASGTSRTAGSTSSRTASSANSSSRSYGSRTSSASSRPTGNYSSSRSASGSASKTSGSYGSRSTSNTGASRSSNSSSYGSRPSSQRTDATSSRSASSYGSSRTSSGRPGYSASRTSSRSASGRSGKKHRFLPNLSGFKRFVTFYAAVLVLILVVGLIIFSSFIGTYEKNQPVNIASTVVENLSGDNAEKYLKENMSDSLAFEDQDTIIQYALQNMSGKTLSFVETTDSGSSIPSYEIKADSTDVVAKVTLESAGKGAFGLSKWKIKTINVADYIPNSYSYDILVPEGYTVTINNVELDDSLITKENSVPDILANVTTYASNLPKFNTYTVSGLLDVPDVVAKDASGNEVGTVTASEMIVVGGKPSDDFVKEQDDFVKNALETWGYYFINYNSPNLSHYVQTGSDLYSYIFGSDTMDPIPVYFYDWEYISDVSFSTFEYGNFVKYSDDCYTVDVKYQLTVTFNNGNDPDDDQELDATWVICKYNGTWAIADLQYHNGSSSSTSVSNSTGSTTSSSSSSTSTQETTTEQPTT